MTRYGGHFAPDEPVTQADLPKVPSGPAQGAYGYATGGIAQPLADPEPISRCYYETMAAALAYMGVDLNQP